MVLADSNVWLALTLSKHQFHHAARAWMAAQAPQEVLFCRATQQSFLRLLTTKAVIARYAIPPLSNKAAWSVYEALLAEERISWVEEPAGLETIWKKMAGRANASPKLWMDAYLAAFAIAGRYRMVTTDQGFEQFKGLDLLLLSKA